MLKEKDNMDFGIIFLLGAGATVDAGMPTVKELTRCIRERLIELRDINDNPTTVFKEIYEYISEMDSSVDDNYEKFFEYIHLITTTDGKNLFKIDMPTNLCEKTYELPFLIGKLVKNILNEYQDVAIPDYLSHLKDYMHPKGRLKVFTT